MLDVPQKLGLAALAIGATLMLSPSAASAFCRTRSEPSPVDDCASNGPSLYWKNRCVGFSVARAASKKADLDKARTLVTQAFTAWTDKAASCTPGVAALEQEPSSANQIGFNKVGANENVIVFRDDTWPYDDAGNPLALTTVTFNAETGEILDADIEVNSADRAVTAAEPLPAQSYDLQSIITHEVGHYFGLAHSKVNGATMESRYDRGQIGLRSLEDDDHRGMCTIYPSENARTTDLPSQAAKTIVAGPCDPVVSIPPPVDKNEPSCFCAHGPGTGAPINSIGVFLLSAAALGAAMRRRVRVGARGSGRAPSPAALQQVGHCVLRSSPQSTGAKRPTRCNAARAVRRR